jgi:UDP-glucuronate decarboxylase
MKIGIVGNGFVGRATKLLACPDIEILVYDIIPKLCEPLNTSLKDINSCDLIFLCLPTPMNHNSHTYTQLLDDTIAQLDNKFIIIRSTVPIGYTEKKNCYFMPEFLTELNWKDDFISSKYWIFGIQENNQETNLEFQTKIQQLFTLSKNHNKINSDIIYFVKNSEAESIKLIKNSFLACKVSYMNEMYELLSKKNVDYNNVKKYLELDPRIGKTHLQVPGYENKRGFGGTCFPKDTHSVYSQLQENNIKSYIIESCLNRNDNHDRREREWVNDKWRTTLPTSQKISLVTGGAGFIGSHLCKKLLELDHIVICLDNLYTGNLNNIKELLNNPNFLYKNADIRNKQYFPHIDYIWHLACPASPPKYQKDGYYTLETSLLGTMNVLELCKTYKCYLFIASTSEIYGEPLEHPQKESYWGNVNILGPRSCYDEGKRCVETLLYNFRLQNKELEDKLKIVRIFNTYGPQMDLEDGRVITNFINAIHHNKPITVYGDGQQTRSFCYIDDLVDGLLKMMFSNEVGPINLGNPNEEMTILELIKVFENITGDKLKLENHELPVNDPKKRKPDITLAKEKLNWDPKINILDGLRKTINFYKL